MQGFPSRAAAAVALAFALLAVLSVAGFDKVALALTSREAASVVDLIEKLTTDFGDFAYDDSEADHWSRRTCCGSQKSDYQGGLQPEELENCSGRNDEGILWTVPAAEIRSIIDGVALPGARVKGSDAEQKKAWREMIEEQTREMMVVSGGRKPGAAVVPRLRLGLVYDGQLPIAERS